MERIWGAETANRKYTCYSSYSNDIGYYHPFQASGAADTSSWRGFENVLRRPDLIASWQRKK
jgi:hypothetical protein